MRSVRSKTLVFRTVIMLQVVCNTFLGVFQCFFVFLEEFRWYADASNRSDSEPYVRSGAKGGIGFV